ncbi:hypothetical protein BJ875DRAFT_144843 [Amylocarpus encephaloides]|uniref:VOC domain-containing protein n=1 Tax=Amylocarpus encephaloides TaxID=45428 RepID=A0A9P7YCC0_9HELO|nr:hypothetical protein BJ875DRAFT_144843 [Amylocarpus encephaloides]
MSEAPADKWTPPPIGTPCWVEVPAADVQALKKFYAALFPLWTWTAATEKYPEERIAMFNFAGKSGLTGGIVHVPAACKDKDGAKVESPNGVGVTLYHFVDSIESMQKKVEELGGKIMSGKEKEGDNGWYMFCLDLEGNRFGIYELQENMKAESK